MTGKEEREGTCIFGLAFRVAMCLAMNVVSLNQQCLNYNIKLYFSRKQNKFECVCGGCEERREDNFQTGRWGTYEHVISEDARKLW